MQVEHLGDGRTSDVGIQDTHMIALALELDSQQGGDGTLAHTAFATDHANDFSDRTFFIRLLAEILYGAVSFLSTIAAIVITFCHKINVFYFNSKIIFLSFLSL